MFQGPPSALAATGITMGLLTPAAHIRFSCIRARPWDDVAVNVLAPTVEAPMRAAIAECSLSTFMYLASIWPVSTSSASFSEMDVWGVMGYAAMTSTLASFAAYAAA